MSIVLFCLIIIVVALIIGAIAYFISGDRDMCGMCVFGTVAVILLFAISVTVYTISMGPDLAAKATALSNQQIVSKTKTISSISQISSHENKYKAFGTFKQDTVCETIKFQYITNDNIICYIKEDDGSVNPISVFGDNIRITTDKTGENSTPRLVKTDTYKTIVLIEKPTLMEDAISSISYDKFQVGDILYIENYPIETTYTAFLTEQEFRALIQNTGKSLDDNSVSDKDMKLSEF